MYVKLEKTYVLYLYVEKRETKPQRKFKSPLRIVIKDYKSQHNRSFPSEHHNEHTKNHNQVHKNRETETA
jgi:hypothetical protein